MGCFIAYIIIVLLITLSVTLKVLTDSGDLEDDDIKYLIMFWAPVIIGIGIIIWSRITAPKREAQRRAKEAQRRAKEAQLEAQRRAKEVLSEITSDRTLRGYLSDLREYHDKAKDALDRAEVNFNDNAYSPFWDEVENATFELGHFYRDINYLSDKLKDYKESARIYEGSVEMFSFPIMSDELEDIHDMSRSLSRRMGEVIKPAQQDFRFASIFEQRRTRKSIAEGFSSFEDSINNVGDQIASEVYRMNSDMASIMEDASAQRERHHDDVMEADERRAEREEQALEMLDDISRRRNRRG